VVRSVFPACRMLVTSMARDRRRMVFTGHGSHRCCQRTCGEKGPGHADGREKVHSLDGDVAGWSAGRGFASMVCEITRCDVNDRNFS
jgi:hypothetical protein